MWCIVLLTFDSYQYLFNIYATNKLSKSTTNLENWQIFICYESKGTSWNKNKISKSEEF